MQKALRCVAVTSLLAFPSGFRWSPKTHFIVFTFAKQTQVVVRKRKLTSQLHSPALGDPRGECSSKYFSHQSDRAR